MLRLITAGLIILSCFFAPDKLIAGQKEKQQDYSVFNAIRLYQYGKTDDAIGYIREMARRNPSNDLAEYYLSNLYLRKGDKENALKAIQKACALDPSNYWYLVQLARLYSISGDFTKAASVYDNIRKNYPQKTGLYDDMIDLYVQQKEYDKALGIINDIEKINGKSEATVLTRFNILIYKGAKDSATSVLKEFDKESGTPRTSAILGDIYMSEQNDSLAMSYYDKALSADPGFSPARFGLSEVYRTRKQFDLYFENINPFLSDVNMNPSMKVSYLKDLLKNVQFVQTFLPQVDTMMMNTYKAHPTDSSVAYEFAGYLYQTGKPDEALKVLQKNVLDYPNDKNSFRQYLVFLYYQERWEDLLKESGYVLTKFPAAPDILELKGISLVKLNRIQEAIDVYKKLSAKGTTDSASRINSMAILGDLHYQSGDKKGAFKYYEKVLKLDPENLPTLNNFAYYLSQEGKTLQKAYEMSKITVDNEPDNPTYLDTFAWILYKMGKYTEAKAIFKHAMLYGGNENSDILDHYAETLFKLKEFDLAFIYWDQAKALNPSLADKITARKKEMK